MLLLGNLVAVLFVGTSGGEISNCKQLSSDWSGQFLLQTPFLHKAKKLPLGSHVWLFTILTFSLHCARPQDLFCTPKQTGMETRAGTNTNSTLLTLEPGTLAMKEPAIDWVSELISGPAFDKSG
jgi:hypothetical protein